MSPTFLDSLTRGIRDRTAQGKKAPHLSCRTQRRKNSADQQIYHHGIITCTRPSNYSPGITKNTLYSMRNFRFHGMMTVACLKCVEVAGRPLYTALPSLAAEGGRGRER
ncbi:hypothetical protein E2C01_092326 [Portunus trituberculatus]|uniref:Uncharacterized protein n=1 Tax=Portunus trituberculatus TaxID=210409 RepID=A0A5B7JVH5_PORTR|nr:hypothetical protein [Portunus trituberculatus]